MVASATLCTEAEGAFLHEEYIRVMVVILDKSYRIWTIRHYLCTLYFALNTKVVDSIYMNIQSTYL